MAERAVDLPKPQPDDDEDVVDWLSTARTLWARGEKADALVWLRRAADAAASCGQPFRASEIGMYVTAIEETFGDGAAEATERTDPSIPREAGRPPQDTLVDTAEAFGQLAGEVLRSRLASIEVDVDEDTLIEEAPAGLLAEGAALTALGPAMVARVAPPGASPPRPPGPLGPPPPPPPSREAVPPRVIVQVASPSPSPATPLPPTAPSATGSVRPGPAMHPPTAPPAAAFVQPLAAPRGDDGEETTLVTGALRATVAKVLGGSTVPFGASPPRARASEAPAARSSGSGPPLPLPPPTPSGDAFAALRDRESARAARTPSAPPPPYPSGSSRPPPPIPSSKGSSPPRSPMPSSSGFGAPSPRRLASRRPAARMPRQPILDPWAEEEIARAKPVPPAPKSGSEEVVVVRARMPSIHEEDDVFTSAAPLPVALRRNVPLVPAAAPPPPPPAPRAPAAPPVPGGVSQPGRLQNLSQVVQKSVPPPRVSPSEAAPPEPAPEASPSAVEAAAPPADGATSPSEPEAPEKATATSGAAASAQGPSGAEQAAPEKASSPSERPAPAARATPSERPVPAKLAAASRPPAARASSRVAGLSSRGVTPASSVPRAKASVSSPPPAKGVPRAGASVSPPSASRAPSEAPPAASKKAPAEAASRAPSEAPPAASKKASAEAASRAPSEAPPAASKKALAEAASKAPGAPSERPKASSLPRPGASKVPAAKASPSKAPLPSASSVPRPRPVTVPPPTGAAASVSVSTRPAASTSVRPAAHAPATAASSTAASSAASSVASAPAAASSAPAAASSAPAAASVPEGSGERSVTFDPARATLPMMLEIEPRPVDVPSMRATLPLPLELPKQLEAFLAAQEAQGVMLEGVSLGEVDVLEGLPQPVLEVLAASAELVELGPDEEVGGFGGALLLEGDAVLCATIVDAAAHWVSARELLVSGGTLSDGIAVRVVGAGEGAKVAVWTRAQLDEALSGHAAAGARASASADRLQALAGATMGPFGEMDDDDRRAIASELSVRVLSPGEIWLEDGAPAPAIALVGAGVIELYGPISEETTDTIEPGALVFPYLPVEGGDAPASARAGAHGALLLTADPDPARRIAERIPEVMLRLRGD